MTQRRLQAASSLYLRSRTYVAFTTPPRSWYRTVGLSSWEPTKRPMNKQPPMSIAWKLLLRRGSSAAPRDQSSYGTHNRRHADVFVCLFVMLVDM